MAGGLAAQAHWAPVQDPSTPMGSPWGVTYLTKARQGPLLTLSTPHVTIVAISHLVEKVPLLELLHATEFSMRLL